MKTVIDDWAYSFLFPKMSRVFVSEDYRSYGKSVMLTEEQWKDWFPDKKFIFDYVNSIVKEVKNEDSD